MKMKILLELSGSLLQVHSDEVSRFSYGTTHAGVRGCYGTAGSSLCLLAGLLPFAQGSQTFGQGAADKARVTPPHPLPPG